MTGLAVTRTVVLGEGGEAPLAVTVRELTVGEIRAWLKDVQGDGTVDLVDVMLLRDVSLQDIGHMSSLTAAQIEGLTPSQLHQVLDAAREINSDFFALRAGILSVGLATQSESLSAPSAA